jgi:hypothetical protein
MRVKLTALTFGCVMACTFFVIYIAAAADDDNGLTARDWLSTVLVSAGAGALMGLLYLPVQKYLHKRGLSMHDDQDFED